MTTQTNNIIEKIQGKVAVVLLRSVRKLGALNTIVHVRKGFAKNFLIPNGFACLATQTNLQNIESTKISLEQNDQQLTHDANALKVKMDGMKIVFYCKTKDAQNIYGSISAHNISEKLSSLGYTINKSQVLLGNNYKSLGNYEVKISLYGNIETTINVIVKSIAEEHADKINKANTAKVSE